MNDTQTMTDDAQGLQPLRGSREDLRPYFLTLDELPTPALNPAGLFQNDQPLEVEIGSGRGLFLLNAASSHPEINFLGVEYDFKEGRRGARRLKKRSLANARVLGADARVVLARYLLDQSAQALHVYFPDPWWKRRHRKRRVFDAGFVSQAARILKPGGLLHAWTDVAEYFDVMTGLVAEHPAFAALAAPTERAALHDMDYHTSFERKKRKLGLPIYRACWTRQ